MLSILSDGGVDRYDDLHIDTIDPLWMPREAWLSGGLEALRLAEGLRNQYGLAFTVVLAFRLDGRYAEKAIECGGVLEPSDFSSSPPSIYLFRKGQEPWNKVDATDNGGKLDHSFVVTAVEALPLTGRITQDPQATYLAKYRSSDTDEWAYTLMVGG